MTVKVYALPRAQLCATLEMSFWSVGHPSLSPYKISAIGNVNQLEIQSKRTHSGRQLPALCGALRIGLGLKTEQTEFPRHQTKTYPFDTHRW